MPVPPPGLALSGFWEAELAEALERYPTHEMRPPCGTYLITGGGGLVGSQLAGVLAAMRAQGKAIDDVIVLDRFDHKDSPIVRGLLESRGINCIQADVTEAIPRLPRVDFIIHAASIPSPLWFRMAPLRTIMVNTLGTAQLLEYADRHAVRRFVHLSSSGIYGRLQGPDEWTESTIGVVDLHDGRACYDESKRLAETICAEAHRRSGLPVTVIRPFNLYGPGQRRDDGRIVPHLLEEALSGGPLHLESDGSPRRSFCYVLDAAVGILAAVQGATPWEVLNVGACEEVSMAELARLVCDLFKIDPSTTRFSGMPSRGAGSGPPMRMPALSAIEQAYGWRPSIQLRDGLERTARYHALLGGECR